MWGMSPDEVVEVEGKMLRREYDALVKAAEKAGIEPNEFLRRAVADEVVIAGARQSGSRILIKPKVGRVKELVAD